MPTPTSFIVKIPLTGLQPPADFVSDVIKYTPGMIASFGTYFRQAAAGTNVPVQFLYAIAMDEERGSHFKPNGTVRVEGGKLRSTGITQIDPAGFYEALKHELSQSRLSDASLAMLNKYIPKLGYTNGMTLAGTPSASVLNTIFLAIKKPEFNIWAGAIAYRLFLEETANPDGTMRPDRAIVKYNVGDYSPIAKLKVFLSNDTTALVKSLNSTTGEYIVKVAGLNGAMDYYIKNKIL